VAVITAGFPVVVTTVLVGTTRVSVAIDRRNQDDSS